MYTPKIKTGLKIVTKNLTSLNGKIQYKLNQWQSVPGNGSYIATSGNLFSGGGNLKEHQLIAIDFDTDSIVVPKNTPPEGVICASYVFPRIAMPNDIPNNFDAFNLRDIIRYCPETAIQAKAWKKGKNKFSTDDLRYIIRYCSDHTIQAKAWKQGEKSFETDNLRDIIRFCSDPTIQAKAKIKIKEITQ